MLSSGPSGPPPHPSSSCLPRLSRQSRSSPNVETVHFPLVENVTFRHQGTHVHNRVLPVHPSERKAMRRSHASALRASQHSSRSQPLEQGGASLRACALALRREVAKAALESTRSSRAARRTEYCGLPETSLLRPLYAWSSSRQHLRSDEALTPHQPHPFCLAPPSLPTF